MLEQVEEQHKEDEDRFKKLQVQDTATLNDKMDQLIVRCLPIHLVPHAFGLRSRCRSLVYRDI